MSKIHPAWDKRRKPGDRFDGTLIRDLDPLHVIMPALYPNRCDNEAYFRKTLDITAIREYVRDKTAPDDPVPYTVFQVLCVCMLKLMYLRPHMNRFIANRLMYQRNEVTASFVVKKRLSDDGAEAMAIVNAAPDDTIQTLHRKLAAQITAGRSDRLDKSSQSMAVVSRMPRRAMRAFVRVVGALEKVGRCPKGFVETDPYYSSVVLTNIGSLGMDAGYHHLTNWGTNSVFVTVGTFRKKLVRTEDGSTEEREFVDLGLTIDERLADGYYYAQSLRCLERLVAHPELLEWPMCELLPE